MKWKFKIRTIYGSWEYYHDVLYNEMGAADLCDCRHETLCMFTGLYDKTGLEIYEHDIVVYDKKFYEIMYFVEYGCFGMFNPNKIKPLGRSGSSTKYEPYLMNKYHTNKMNIVGNKYQQDEKREVCI